MTDQDFSSVGASEAGGNKVEGRILVVDDEETMRRSFSEILRLEGYQVDSAGSTPQAIEALRRSALEQAPAEQVPGELVPGELAGIYDVILLDLRMPGDGEDGETRDEEAGMRVLRYVAEQAADTQVIVLTAHGSLETAIEALRHSALDYLLKPASPQQILASVDKACQRRQELLRQRRQAEQAGKAGMLLAVAAQQANQFAAEVSQTLERLGNSLESLRQAAETNPVEGMPAELVPTKLASAKLTAEPVTQTGSEVAYRGSIVAFGNSAGASGAGGKPAGPRALGSGLMIDLARREIWQYPEKTGQAAEAGGRRTERSDTSQSRLRPQGLRRISLTPTEGKLMQVFIDHPGQL